MLVDWSQLILEARNKTGLSVSTIARHINSTEKHLNRLARGEQQEPRWSTAIKLLDYYYENVDKDFSRIRID